MLAGLSEKTSPDISSSGATFTLSNIPSLGRASLRLSSMLLGASGALAPGEWHTRPALREWPPAEQEPPLPGSHSAPPQRNSCSTAPRRVGWKLGPG